MEKPRAVYEAFFDRYDALIGLLCLAAHEGMKPEIEIEFAEIRTWFHAHYPRLKPRIAPFVALDDNELEDELPRNSTACDAFEALYLPGSVAAILEADSGSLIGLMIRTQQALDAWSKSITRDEGFAAVGA